MSMSFPDCLTFEAFKAVLDLQISMPSLPRGGSAVSGRDQAKDSFEDWMRRREEVEHRSIYPALVQFLSARKDAGLLFPIPGTLGRSGSFMNAWNGMVTDNSWYQANTEAAWLVIAPMLIDHALFKALHGAARQISDGASYDTTAAEAYKQFVAQVDRGDFRWWANPREEHCFRTGDLLRLDVQNWNIVLGKMPQSEHACDLVPIEPIEFSSIVEGTVMFETGDLLISEWFNIPEFTKLFGHIDRSVDLNTPMGWVEMTKRYLHDFGVVCVRVDMTTPCIYEQDGCLVLGRTDALDSHAPAEIGFIPNPYRTVTIIDRKKLVDLVASQVGRNQAEAKVQNLLKNDNEHIVQVKVRPGTHHLYFSADRVFREEFKAEEMEINPRIEPAFLLSDRPMTLTPNKGMEPEASTPRFR